VSASFENGGEQLYSVTQGLTVGVQHIGFGAEISVLPTYNPDSKNLDVKLSADVSDLTAAASGSTLPGRITSKLNTEITLKLGQAVVLSGIRSKSESHTRSGLPGLSDIPILGLLFGTNAKNELETEGAIFIVPSVITSATSQSKEMVDVALAKFKDYSGDIDGVEAYRKTPGAPLDVPVGKK
jgi:pilus assembly protein CpaC